ncbi:RING-H2 zinc finger domain-containing protein [Spironucleus salmonicida]|uniref:HRT1-like protein n=1 Tax=Spironucleus salmonicida TaxID=348837 RepID=V6LKR0_9EUKA|nr:RING-H2 zinc finger domain-containing protein [Spironucleus salmonicida]|eukprot:EST45210.1 HRT1-like protein [Spironucleus salmonicida]
MKIIQSFKLYAEKHEKILICNICAGKLSQRCQECRDSSCEICPVVKGICGHSFHQHCINSWLQQTNICALCSVDWFQVD